MSADEYILITRRSRAVNPRQIAPEHADLEFARYNPTGTVHVLPYTPGPYDEGFDPADISWAEAGLLMLEPTIMICGDRFVVNDMDLPNCGVRVNEFADMDICDRCFKTLGDQSVRAFEHPQAPPRRKA